MDAEGVELLRDRAFLPHLLLRGDGWLHCAGRTQRWPRTPHGERASTDLMACILALPFLQCFPFPLGVPAVVCLFIPVRGACAHTGTAGLRNTRIAGRIAGWRIAGRVAGRRLSIPLSLTFVGFSAGTRPSSKSN